MSTYQIEAVHVWIRIGEAAGVGSTPGRATESGHFRVFGKTQFDTFFDFCFVDVVVTEKGPERRAFEAGEFKFDAAPQIQGRK